VKASAVQIAQLVVAIIALFTGWVLAGVAYQTFGRGPIPEKHLTGANTGAIDVLNDLKNAGDPITTSVLAFKKRSPASPASVLTATQAPYRRALNALRRSRPFSQPNPRAS
jgi:hypothetical protein